MNVNNINNFYWPPVLPIPLVVLQQASHHNWVSRKNLKDKGTALRNSLGKMFFALWKAGQICTLYTIQSRYVNNMEQNMNAAAGELDKLAELTGAKL